MSLRTFLASLLLFISLSSIARTQPELGHPNDTGLLLEVTFVKSTPPTYQTVYGPDSQNPGNWSTRFGKVAGWQLPPGALPVRAVRILPVLTGKTVTVLVSVLRGHKHLDTENAVGTYTLRENEKLRVEEAKNFGVEPFEIKVIRVSSLPNNMPTVENRIPSLEVVGIEPVVSTLPLYKLTFRNLSKKSIEALTIEVMQGARVLSTGRPRGSEGKPLIPPGETVECRVPLETRAEGTADNYSPAVSLEQRVVISGVLFSDGAAEGLMPRIDLQGEKYGRKIALRRILRLLESALAEADSDLIAGPTKLRLQIEESFSFTDAELADPDTRSTVNEGDSKSLELGLHLIKGHVLDPLRRFSAVADPRAFRSWLVRAKEQYSNWLLRLEATEVS